MKMRIFLGGFFIILLCVSIVFFSTKQQTATINGHTFFVEVAKTQKEQEIGLAKYTSLPSNRAMYFPFAKPDYYNFWMKDMRFPIDILFIRNGKLITIIYSAPAPRAHQVDLPIYQPTGLADSVLEINAGLSKQYGFKVGNTVRLTE